MQQDIAPAQRDESPWINGPGFPWMDNGQITKNIALTIQVGSGLELWRGIELQQLTYKVVEDGCLVVVTGERRGRPLVAFMHFDSIAKAIVMSGRFLHDGIAVWKLDESPWRKKSGR